MFEMQKNEFKFPEMPDMFKMMGVPFPSMPVFNVLNPIDIKEKENELEILMDVPGFSKENLSITLQDGILSVKGKQESESEKEEKYIHRERCVQSFERTITIDKTILPEEIKSEYKDGVLAIHIPKKEEKKEEPKKSEIAIE